MNIPEVHTERLVMRGFREEDLDEVAAINADAEVTRWVGDENGLSRQETWRRMAYWLGHWELRGFGQWALEERETGRLVGRTGLLQPEGWPGLEVGWLVAHEHWGRGIAPEAGRAAIEWAREELGADRIISLIEDHNHNSARVAEKLGMKVEGRTRILDEQIEVRIFAADLGTSSP
jgi:RimJ/RimL family protein N-acetyltransferase